MKLKEFKSLIKKRMAICNKVLIEKNNTYADIDVLSNFKRAAELQRVSVEDALLGMLTKHTVAIYDFVYRLRFDEHVPAEEWEDKLTDIHNYFYLLEAVLQEHCIIQPWAPE